jgi:hypothetical protein
MEGKTLRIAMPIILFILLLFTWQAIAQASQPADSLQKIRDQHTRHMLDLRFRGGAGEFERQLLAAVDYTDRARRDCVLGVVILSFTVSCDNELGDFRMRNPLGYGINEQLSEFFNKTANNWNKCDDDRYTRFEIPVAFTLEGSQTGGRGFITVEGLNPGYRCRADQYFIDRLQRYRERGRVKKAIEMVDVLIRRDPLNTAYTEIKLELLSGD